MKKLKLLTCALLCLGIGTTKAQYTDLLNFTGTANGAGPNGSVIQSGSTLYGLTSAGGLHSKGCIFSISNSGSGYSDMHDFDGTDGNSPQADLLLSEGVLYGTTYLGGAHNYGRIFSINPNGTGYTDLFDFNSSNGSEPYCTLTLGNTGSSNVFYGTTYSGGTGYGTIFSITTTGRFTDLFNFSGTNGGSPLAGLITAPPSSGLYGMTSAGGAHSDGCIFVYYPEGNSYTDLFDFNSTTGKAPEGELTASPSGSTLYGMTLNGGANNYGCVFSIGVSGTGYTDLLDFNGTNGKYPYGSLELSNGVLYGITSAGGAHGDGLIFTITTTGANYTDLLDFDGTTSPYGQYATGHVTLSNDILYSMTFEGGTSNAGTLFSFGGINDLGVTTSVTNETCAGSNNGSITADPSYGISPYTYSWSPTGKTTQTITALSAGTYTITVTDNNGNTATASGIISPPSTLTVSTNPPNCLPGNMATISAQANGGVMPYAYEWQPGSERGASVTVSLGLGPQTYTVTVTDNCGTTATASVTVNCPPEVYHPLQKGTTEMAASDISFYPNPNNGQFTIAGIAGGMIIETYDYMGRLVNTITANAETMQVNLANQANGIYLIRILSKDGTLLKQTKMMKVQ